MQRNFVMIDSQLREVNGGEIHRDFPGIADDFHLIGFSRVAHRHGAVGIERGQTEVEVVVFGGDGAAAKLDFTVQRHGSLHGRIRQSSGHERGQAQRQGNHSDQNGAKVRFHIQTSSLFSWP